MKSIVAKLLSLLLLIQSLGINSTSMAQIDELIEHAKFHKDQYGDNLFVFISKHYGDLMVEHATNHEEEKEQHQELPFKHHPSSTANYAFLSISVVLESNLEIPSDLKISNYFYKDPVSSCYLEGLLEPPRCS